MDYKDNKSDKPNMAFSFLIPNKDDLQKSKMYLRSKGIKTEQLQLDFTFPPALKGRNDLRHIPNDYARSSLFSVRNRRQARKNFVREPIFHYNSNVLITYTGIELRAEDDELVWLQILNYGQSVELGTPFEFNIKDLVHDVGWSKSGKNYDRIRDCISRLKATEILAQNDSAYGKSGAVSLIQHYESVNDEISTPTRYRVWITPGLMLLFAGSTFSSHNWEKYIKLTPVARRLADWVASHKVPYDLDINKFKQICGSSNANNYSWRNIVRGACKELVDADIVVSAVLVKDSIRVIRNANVQLPNAD